MFDILSIIDVEWLAINRAKYVVHLSHTLECEVVRIVQLHIYAMLLGICDSVVSNAKNPKLGAVEHGLSCSSHLFNVVLLFAILAPIPLMAEKKSQSFIIIASVMASHE